MTRINKWLSEMGVCSKNQADRLIQQGEVSVNGETAILGMSIHSGDCVSVSGEPVTEKPNPVFLLYHKPVGVVCTYDLKVKNNLAQSVDYPQRVFALGRLDKDSEGLMLLTNQGDVVNKIMRAENNHEKLYRVWLDKPISEDFVCNMSAGVEVLQTVTLPCKVVKIDEMCFEITLTQGLNRQIRRMCQTLGYRVERLQRLRIMAFELQELAPGRTRLLNKKESESLLERIYGSSNVV